MTSSNPTSPSPAAPSPAAPEGGVGLGEEAGIVNPVCTDCPDRAACRDQGYCPRSNRVLPRTVVLEYRPDTPTDPGAQEDRDMVQAVLVERDVDCGPVLHDDLVRALSSLLAQARAEGERKARRECVEVLLLLCASYRGKPLMPVRDVLGAAEAFSVMAGTEENPAGE